MPHAVRMSWGTGVLLQSWVPEGEAPGATKVRGGTHFDSLAADPAVAWNEGVGGGTVVEEVDGTEGSGTGGGVRLVHSPVPSCEGPGAPSLWSGKVIGTRATRQPSHPELVDGKGWSQAMLVVLAFPLFVGALEVLDAVRVKVPEAGGYLVDEVVVVRD